MLIREDLYHALHNLHPVSHFEYKRIKKKALPQPHGMVLDTDPLTNITPTLANISLHDIPRNRTRRIAASAILSAVLPAVGKLATLAVEKLGSYLQKKGNTALTKALQLLDHDLQQTRNMIHQLEQDFILYGEYDVNSTQSIINLLGKLNGSTDSLEGWLLYNSRDIAKDMIDTLTGPVYTATLHSCILNH